MARTTLNQTAPLRMIIGTRDVVVTESGRTVPMEVLDCGHEQPVKQDIYGDTHPVRRRCRRCR